MLISPQEIKKMDREQLERLRHMNQDLLQRLKANQEEFKKRIPIKPPSPSLLPQNAAPKNQQVPNARNGVCQMLCWNLWVTWRLTPGYGVLLFSFTSVSLLPCLFLAVSASGQ